MENEMIERVARGDPAVCRECWGLGGDKARGDGGQCERCGRTGPLSDMLQKVKLAIIARMQVAPLGLSATQQHRFAEEYARAAIEAIDAALNEESPAPA